MANKRKDNKGRVLKKGESQRKNGTYMYRWVDNREKPNWIYAETLEGLRAIEAQVEKDRIMGVVHNNVTLNEQIDIYLMTKNKLANSTKENYTYYYKHSIKDSRLGKMKVTNIKKSDILLFYKSLSDEGYAPGTLKIIQKIIHPALQLACDDDIIIKNPSDGCLKGYDDDPEKKYALTFDEEAEFLERVLSKPRMKRYYFMYAILLKTGLRISEAIGLTWDEVDMDEREITIDHQVQYRSVKGEMQLYASKTKTKSGVRTIPMTDEVYKLFLEQRKVWFSTKKDPEFSVDGYKDFVFVSHMTGKCMNHNSIRRMMRSIVEMNSSRKIQLPDISPHILRHTTVCRLAESGYDIKVVQYLMGQVDIRTTMRVYNHVDLERVKREIARVDRLKMVAQ